MDRLKALEEYEAAILLEIYGKSKVATVLLAKAMFALADILLLGKYKYTPKNHSSRFIFLQKNEVWLYDMVDKAWEKYTSTYTKPTEPHVVALFKQTIWRIISHGRYSQNLTNCIEKTKENS